MTGQLQECPQNWKKGCYPHPCQPPPKPSGTSQPAPPTPHNIVYLVDEHLVKGIQEEAELVKTRGNSPTLQARYAWHYGKANLYSFNVGETPDTIKLHEKIADPTKHKVFRWDGFMFALRVGIVAGAESANPTTLETPGGKGSAPIDRVVGFAGTYPDPNVPFGPVVQVRRDDQYRQLGQSFLKDGKSKVVWRCAYYITKDTPLVATTPVGLTRDGMTLLADEVAENSTTSGQSPNAQDSGGSPSYDDIMDQTVSDEIDIDPDNPNDEKWGGNVFGVVWADGVASSTPDSDTNFLAEPPVSG